MAGAILTTGKVDYNTPQWMVDDVKSFFGGYIDLDPCSNESSVVGAKNEFILPYKNGMTDFWGVNQKIYVNPPFGYDKNTGIGIGNWVAKALDAWEINDCEVIMCIPAAVETAWWQDIIFPQATGICWLNKRVRFPPAKDVVPKPIALVYFGNRSVDFCKHFKYRGATYNPSETHAQY